VNDDKIHLFNETPDVKVLLWLGSEKIVSLDDLEELPEYDQILKQASQILILDGTIIKVRFHQTKNKFFPLEPSIEYEEMEINAMPNCNLAFWPNIELDTEDMLKRFTEQKWEAIIISHGVVFSTITLLVVRRVGKVYERIGIARGTYGSASFKDVVSKAIALR
jgi:hypothetical protein